MSADDFDFSPEAFMAALGADVMERIDRSVAAAPPPGPLLIERLRSIFAPAVNRLLDTKMPVRNAEAA